MSELLTVGNLAKYQIQLSKNGRDVFRITPEGEIIHGDKQITDDDAAVADVFRKFVLYGYGLQIRPANRSSDGES